MLASAVAVELRRQEAIDEDAAPVSAGMSKETLAVITGDEVNKGALFLLINHPSVLRLRFLG